MREALIRHVFRGRVMSALPMIVVEETDERVVVFLREGTPIRWADGPIDAWIDAGCPTYERTWVDTNTVHIVPKGRAHSIYFMREAATDNEVAWYVNLQEPLRETRLGWDTCDQELDVVAWPDLSQWWWKDEAEFEDRIRRGFLTPEEGAAVRAEGVAVIADIEARRGVFAEPWRDWRPDPSWPIPSLPDDWDDLG